MIYYSFNEPALNGFTPILEHKYDSHPLYKLVEKISIPTYTLEATLDKYLPPHTSIDFLSVDVEGLDLEVLQSNNWDKYRPRIILIECWDSDLENVYQSEIYTFLAQRKYKLFAKTMNTLIFESSLHE